METEKKEKLKLPGKFFWMRALAVFLGIMLAFTIASRAADSLTVPNVSTARAVSGKIVHTVTADGTVEPNRERAVVTEPDILIGHVNVRAGERVEAGDVLLELDMDSLGRQIDLLESQVKKLQLENKAVLENKKLAEDAQALAVARAREDYEDALAKNAAAAGKAEEAFKGAQSDLSSAEQELSAAEDARADAEQKLSDAKGVLSAREQELKEADDRLAEALRQLEQAKQELSDALESGDVTEELKQAVEEKQAFLEQSQAAADEKQSAYEKSMAEVSAKQAFYEERQAVLAEKQAAYETNKEQAGSKADASDETKWAGKESEKAAARALEDAENAVRADNTEQINAISIEQYEKQLERLRQLEAKKGIITAENAGTVTKVYAQTGQKTTDTAALTVSEDADGFRFAAAVDSESAKYIAAGDTAIISGNGKKEEGMVETVQSGGDDGTVKVTVSMQENIFFPGESAEMTVKQESERYTYTIPTTALLQENNKTYVLVLDIEDTVLGQQYTARKMEVTVEDKNNGYAAISANGISADMKIITDSDRSVEAGDKVRLADQ